jgi:hypothetical protein
MYYAAKMPAPLLSANYNACVAVWRAHAISLPYWGLPFTGPFSTR